MKKQKIISILCPLLLFFFVGYSQIKKDHITDEYVAAKYKIGGAVERLGEDKTFRFAFPTEINHHQGKENNRRWSNLRLYVAAKSAKGEGQPYKIFEIYTKGLVQITRVEDVQVPMPGNPTIYGWVRKVYFTFPLSVVGRTATGELEKELVISNASDELMGMYHADMLTEDPLALGGERANIPFPTKDRLIQAYDASKAAIEKRLERNEILKFYGSIERAIYAAYDYTKLGKMFLFFYTIKKAEKVNYSDFAAMDEKMKIGLKDLADETKFESAVLLLNECCQFYKQKLEQKSTLAPDLAGLCLYNGSISALVSGNIEDAKKWYADYHNNYYKGLDGYNRFETTYTDLYSAFAPYYKIKRSNDKVVELKNELAEQKF